RVQSGDAAGHTDTVGHLRHLAQRRQRGLNSRCRPLLHRVQRLEDDVPVAVLGDPQHLSPVLDDERLTDSGLGDRDRGHRDLAGVGHLQRELAFGVVEVEDHATLIGDGDSIGIDRIGRFESGHYAIISIWISNFITSDPLLLWYWANWKSIVSPTLRVPVQSRDSSQPFVTALR